MALRVEQSKTEDLPGAPTIPPAILPYLRAVAMATSRLREHFEGRIVSAVVDLAGVNMAEGTIPLYIVPKDPDADRFDFEEELNQKVTTPIILKEGLCFSLYVCAEPIEAESVVGLYPGQ